MPKISALLLFTALLYLHGLGLIEAQRVECNSTSDCEFLLKEGLVCGNDGFCINPYIGGCLRNKLGEKSVPKKRACNSHDDQDAEKNGICEKSAFDYMEIRISPGNWESAMLYGWIMQIFLSEVLQVPVSLDTGIGGGDLNFYDPYNGFAFNKVGYNFEGIKKSNEVIDCRLTDDSCTHVLPEFWSQLNQDVFDGYEFDSAGNGMVGYLSWYVPSYLVQQDPILASHYGYKNRTKLAEIFKRPTTWGDYCEIVSENNCTIKDEFATRAPISDDEKNSYYSSLDTYKGFFRKTEKNDCSGDKNTTCTGHFVDYPCSWNAYTKQQLHWNEIPLESEISYSYGELMQIYKAAEATNSAIILLWWYPDSNIEQYDFWEVKLTGTSRECVNNRAMPPAGKSRCDVNQTDLIGSELGSCGYQTQTLETVIAPSVRINELEMTEAMKSPAYAAMRNLLVSDIDISDLLNEWVQIRQDNTAGYDAREVVCSWVESNYILDDSKDTAGMNPTKQKSMNINKFIPHSYPRKIERIPYYSGYNYAAITFGAFAIILISLIYVIAFHYRSCKVMKVAQKVFLDLFAFGYLLVCIGAIVSATAPTDVSCISRQWLITLGYTQGVVPLLVKVAAINRLMQQAKKMKRVQISRTHLFEIVAFCTLIITAYLIAWTIVDPPQKLERPSLTSEDSNLVEIRVECGSSSKTWMAIAYIWEAIYILGSAILAFQSRNLRSDFNESKEIANMAYVHFVFFIIRVMVWLLPSNVLQSNQQEAISSFVLSLDALVCITLYFGPKIWRARKEKKAPLGAPTSTVCAFTRNHNERSCFPSSAQSEIYQRYSQPSDAENISRRRNSFSSFSAISSFGNASQPSQCNTDDSKERRRNSLGCGFGMGSAHSLTTKNIREEEAYDELNVVINKEKHVNNEALSTNGVKKAGKQKSQDQKREWHDGDTAYTNRDIKRVGEVEERIPCTATTLTHGQYPFRKEAVPEKSPTELTKIYRRFFFEEEESSVLSGVLEDMSSDAGEFEKSADLKCTGSESRVDLGLQEMMVLWFEEMFLKNRHLLTGEDAATDEVFIDHFGDRGSYSGSMVNGVPNGYGRIIYDQDSRSYEGNWWNGKLHGAGVMNYSNGDVYRGDFFKDLMKGTGIYQWKDGRVYHGEFRDDVREGLGIYSWPDGSCYTGYFHEGKMHGYGSFLNPGGVREVGEFLEGRFHKEMRIDKTRLATPKSKLGQEILESLKQEVDTTKTTRAMKRVSFSDDDGLFN